MDLPRFLALVKARRRLIAVIVGAAAILALVASLAQPSRYQASADLLYGRTSTADSIIAGGATDTAATPESLAATNVALASLDSVAVNVKRRFPGPVTFEQLRKAVSIKAQGVSNVVTVTAQWDTPAQAAAIANAFATEIVALRRGTAQADIQTAIDALKATVASGAGGPAAAAGLQTRIGELEALKASQTGDVRIVNRATPPTSRSSPKPLRNAVIAAFVAAVLALFVVLLLARYEDRVGDEDELAALLGAPVLARIPELPRSARPAHVRDPDQDPAFLEAFEFLRMNLQLIAQDADGMIVAVTSPAPGDGKSTVVAWLAQSLAMSGEEVVAVDLDLRKPELHDYLDADVEPGSSVLDALLAANGKDATSALMPLAPETAQSDDSDVLAASDKLSEQGRRVYTDDHVTVGLVELSRHSGNARRAARSLRAAGKDVPESTLRRWREVHPDLYEEIRAVRPQGTPVAPHLRLLTAGNHGLPAGLLAKGRLDQLFEHLRQDADFALADTVPVSTVADATAVAAAADGVILVVDMSRDRRRDLLAAKKQLANARARLLGIVVTRAPGDFPAYYGGEEDRGQDSS